MPWSTKVHADLKVVEVCYVGKISPSELSDAATAVLALCRTNKMPYVLADLTDIEGGHSNVTLFQVAKSVASSPDYSFLKEAIILPRRPEAMQDAIFWRDTAINRGITVELFPDREIAIAWLLAR